jgi:hypothetical protein
MTPLRGAETDSPERVERARAVPVATAAIGGVVRLDLGDHLDAAVFAQAGVHVHPSHAPGAAVLGVAPLVEPLGVHVLGQLVVIRVRHVLIRVTQEVAVQIDVVLVDAPGCVQSRKG